MTYGVLVTSFGGRMLEGSTLQMPSVVTVNRFVSVLYLVNTSPPQADVVSVTHWLCASNSLDGETKLVNSSHNSIFYN